MACQLSVALFLHFGPTEEIGATEMRFALAIAHQSIRVVPVGPTEITDIHIF